LTTWGYIFAQTQFKIECKGQTYKRVDNYHFSMSQGAVPVLHPILYMRAHSEATLSELFAY